MIDLAKFCSRDAGRISSIGTPWTVGEWTYATDGHIAIRVPRRDDVTRSDGPDVQRVMDKAPAAKDMRPVPVIDTSGMARCRTT